MPIRTIVPKSALSLQPSRPVTDFNDIYVKKSIQDLFDSLANIQTEIDKTRPEASGGVGLAANQIEYPESDYPKDFVPYNIYVVNVRALRASNEKCEEVQPSVYINATFVSVADELNQLITSEYTEGCLSIAGIFSPKTPRSENIVLTYFDAQGTQQTLKTQGFIARVHQHELDHGLGNEFLNHLNFTESELYEISKWLGQSRQIKPGDWILEGKLQVVYTPAGIEALHAWVSHELQKKTPSLMMRISTDNNLFASHMSPSSASSVMSTGTPPSEDEAMSVGNLRLR
jgi:peptide deformylase